MQIPFYFLAILHIVGRAQQIGKLGELFVEEELNRVDRAVAVLGDDDIGDVLIFRFSIVVVFAVEEHYDVGILLERA